METKPTGQQPAPSQIRLWFLSRLLGREDNTYNAVSAYRLTGKLDIEALRRSLCCLVDRHDSLRMVFPEIDGEPQVRWLPPYDPLLIHDSRITAGESAETIEQLVDKKANGPFAIDQGPLFRAQLFLQHDDQSILVFTFHHIIFDGWSGTIFRRELSTLYGAFLSGAQTSLQPLPMGYADYARQQRKKLESGAFSRQLDYWKNQLTDLPASLDLPFARPRTSIVAHQGGQIEFRFSSELSVATRSFAVEHRVTPFMLLMAVLHLLLHRYSGQEDIAVGFPIAGRRSMHDNDMVGLFVNTLVIRTKPTAEMTFVEFLQLTRLRALEAMSHQDLPFDVLVESLDLDRNNGVHPVFQVMFTYQNIPGKDFELQGLVCERLRMDFARGTKTDLGIELIEKNEGISGCVHYSRELFNNADIKRMAGHFPTLLQSCIERPDTAISKISYLTTVERQQLFAQAKGRRNDYPKDKTLDQLVFEQVERTPQNVAYVCGTEALSYHTFNQYADALAWQLQQRGIRRGDNVPVLMSRSLAFPVTLYAVSKCGAAFVPLNTEWPDTRLNQVLMNLHYPVLLTDAPTDKRQLSSKPLIVDLQYLRTVSERPRQVNHRSEDPLYIIFTSGSTGIPKGAINTHRAFINYLHLRKAWFHWSEHDIILQTATPSYDVSIQQVFTLCLTGGKLIIPANQTGANPDTILELLCQGRATQLGTTPSLLNTLLDCLDDHDASEFDLSRLKSLAIGGEALDITGLKRLRGYCPEISISNLYGPSEAAVDSVGYKLGPITDDAIPIGKPMDNTVAIALDAQLQPLPVGIPGELFLGGDCLGLGYLNDDEQTEKSFIKNPIAGIDVERLYRTGDRVVRRDDGNLVFLGRLDRQVKIRGIRIELTEIESRINHFPAVKQSTVMLNGTGNRVRIIACLVLEPGYRFGDSTRNDLRQYLRRHLPTYMLPNDYLSLPQFPVTANGKIDLKALSSFLPSSRVNEKPVPLRGETEKILATIWEELLSVSGVNPQSDFFALGGHSLLAVKLMIRISDHLDRDIPLSWLFDHPSIRELADEIDTSLTIEQRAQSDAHSPESKERETTIL